MNVSDLPAMKNRIYRAILGPAALPPLTAEQQAARDKAQAEREALTWENHWERIRAARNAASVARYAS